uniref:Uncharacterized protein n=2 Tax=Tetranychus urticae TaxID=32264 RepID=T1KYV6_TETUR
MNQNIQDASKSYSQIYNAPHHPASSQQSSSTSTLLSHQNLYKQRNDDDVLPPPPPEAYSDSENQHIHPSNTKINCSRREFLQTLNAKLSVFQNQRLSPKLVKRRSMSLPHSDQEWDSDSGITSQSTSSNKSSPRGSTSSHSESFSQSFTERLGTYGSRNSNNCNNIYQSDGTKNRNNSVCHKNQNQNTSNNSHSTYASFLYSEADVKNVPQNFGYSDSDNVNDHSLSKMKMNSSQHSEVAKAAATEAIRRKKSQSECSLESNIRESSSQINPESHQSSSMHASASENTSSNCMDRIYRSHQHYLSHYNHQHHPSNPFHQNYASENMQTENVYTTRNQSVYQSTSNPNSACFSESLPNNYQQKSISQPAMSTLSKNRQIPIGHPLSSGNCSTGNKIDSLQTAANKNQIIRDQVDMNGRSQSSSVPGDSQHIQKNSGDIPSCVDENNRAGSEGSITPTNPDRNSPTYESSKSTVLSYIKREPVQLSALKSTKSYPGSHLAESLYSSTGTLSRLGKPAPPPPVRKTSSISDPNAITLGTLRSAGVSTYEEIKTLKRHSRNRSGGSSFNTYEELNSDKNAIYYAARKSCLSTSLTSLVEPIYSTLDSNSTGTANYYDSKSVTVNSLGNQEKQDSSKPYSQIQDPKQHPTSSVAFTVF